MKKKYHSIPLLCCLAIGLVLSGCGGTPTRTGPPAEVVDQQVGERDQVEDTTRIHAAPYDDYILPDSDAAAALENASILVSQGQYGLAQKHIEDLDPVTMTPDMLTLKRTLDATILLQAGGVKRASSILQSPPTSAHAPTLQGFYRVRAETDLMLGRTLPAVQNLITQELYMGAGYGGDGSSSGNVQPLLWAALGMISTGELSRLAQSSDSTLSGWARLSLAVRSSHGSMAGTDQAITLWRSTYPSHPATTELLDSIRLAATTQGRQPARIALLLPISSRYAQAAGAVRDGITAMNKDLPASQRNSIKLYDYGSDQKLVALYYRQAANDGADIIIGPLGRSATSQLLTASVITTPTILLSPAPEDMSATANLYTFALSPEQEARQAAQRTWLDGKRTAVMMYPKDALGQRMARAYREQFMRLGGKIIGEAFYDSAGSEGYSAQISKLLGVDQSEQRINELSRRLGTKLKHEARRRQDIEAIFLPATTDDARLIKPEFDFYYALDLPVYSTSRVFSGKLDSVNDADLNRVRFPDMPWMVANNVEIESLRTFMHVEQMNEGNRYDRLYAIGMDLHALAAKLENLSTAPQLYMQGLTGNLHITDNGVIEHDMIWAEFRNGTPKLLDRNTGYQGRYDEWKYKNPTRAAPATRQSR